MIGNIVHNRPLKAPLPDLDCLKPGYESIVVKSISRLEYKGFSVPSVVSEPNGVKLAAVSSCRAKVYDGNPDGWVIISYVAGKLEFSTSAGLMDLKEFRTKLGMT